jgi:hypothetical protein
MKNKNPEDLYNDDDDEAVEKVFLHHNKVKHSK